MVVLVVLLWACGIVAGSCAIPGEPWLPTLRERLEQAQRAVELEETQRAVELDHTLRAVGRLKPLTARDAERQELLRRWLELRMAKEKAARFQVSQYVFISIFDKFTGKRVIPDNITL